MKEYCRFKKCINHVWWKGQNNEPDYWECSAAVRKEDIYTWTPDHCPIEEISETTYIPTCIHDKKPPILVNNCHCYTEKEEEQGEIK